MDPPKRERKRHINYAENEYFRNALKTGAPRASGPRMPKLPPLLDFQFFDSERINQLVDKQHAYELFNYERKKEIAERAKVLLPPLQSDTYIAKAHVYPCEASLLVFNQKHVQMQVSMSSMA